MRARRVLSIFCLVLTSCGARSEIRGGTSDASVPSDAGNDAATTSCASGVVQLATTGLQPDTIVLDGEWVYWHDATGIFRMKKSGGGSETLGHPIVSFWPDLAAFGAADGQLFWQNGMGVATSKKHVFQWSRDELPTALVRFDFDGSNETQVAVLQHEPIDMTFTSSESPCIAEDPGVECGGQLLSGLTATDIAVSGNDVFFTSNDSTNGARVMHLVMPSLKTAPIADTTGAFAIARDDSDLFFTDGLDLRVRRIEGKTGPVVDIASDPGFGPIDIVVDDTCVYWTASSRFDKTGTGVVMAAPKK